MIALITGLIKSILSMLAGPFVGFVAAWKLKEERDLKEELKAHETRQEVEDDLSKQLPSARRVRLGKWVRGIQGDKADER